MVPVKTHIGAAKNNEEQSNSGEERRSGHIRSAAGRLTFVSAQTVSSVRIWKLLRCRIVTIHEPNLAISEILQQIPIIAWSHIARPNDFGVIYIGTVVHPFVVGIVMRFVTNEHELEAGFSLQLAQERGSF